MYYIGLTESKIKSELPGYLGKGDSKSTTIVISKFYIAAL